MINYTGKIDGIISDIYKLDREEVYDVKITKHREKRSLEANAYFHTLINQLAKEQRSEGFAKSDEDLKREINLMYGTVATDDKGNQIIAKLPKYIDTNIFYPYCKRYNGDDKFNYYLFYKRTHELDSKEFYQLLKGTEEECKKYNIKILSDIEFEEMMEKYKKI